MKLLVLIFTILFYNASYGQYRKLNVKNPPPPGGYSEKIRKAEKENHTCIKLPKKSFSTLLKKYPFNKSTQIQLVSFKGDGLPIENDTICQAKLFEIKSISLLQVDSLTNIMYNIGYGGTILFEEEVSCYNPKNAILFIDSTGKIFEYIEICFECSKVVLSSDKIEFGEACNEKYDLIKKQFLQAGIRYGIVEAF